MRVARPNKIEQNGYRLKPWTYPDRWPVSLLETPRVDHQRSDTMYSRTLFPGIRTNVVRLLHTENVALLVVRLYTKSEERARLYHWFMPSKRSLSDVR